jgi:hypothetical protein
MLAGRLPSITFDYEVALLAELDRKNVTVLNLNPVEVTSSIQIAFR